MDHLCENYPQESISFFKRAIQMTVITGISLVIPTASCIYATWNSPEGSDRGLRYWSVFRVLIFLVQLPLRYRIWCMLHEAQQATTNNSFEISRKLCEVLKTKEWKLTQYFSGLLSAWVFVTLVMTTMTMETNFPTERTQDFEVAAFACYRGYLSPCLYRLCWVSIGILCVHLAFVFLWLRSVLDSNTLISITPLQIREVSSIIKFNQNDPFHKDKFDQCSICLQEYESNDELRIFHHCNHHFHKECIDQWLNKRARCPLCNHKILDGLQMLESPNRQMLEFETNQNNNNDPNNDENNENEIENEERWFEGDRLNSDDEDENDNQNENENENQSENQTENNNENSNENSNEQQNRNILNEINGNEENINYMCSLPSLIPLSSDSNDSESHNDHNSDREQIMVVNTSDNHIRNRHHHHNRHRTRNRNRHRSRNTLENILQSPQTPNTPLQATWEYLCLSQN